MVFRHVFALVILTTYLIFNHSQKVGFKDTIYTKDALLTPQKLYEEGATINISSPSEVTSSTNFWNINANNEQTWHLMVDLDSSWGFNPHKPSSISVEIYSPTTPNSNDPLSFDDIVIGFQVKGRNKWAAVRLYMDNQ